MNNSKARFFLTTAIDYPNSRPHIGTAFEKIGADVQARYRRMEGFDVQFLMGNDENTIKVAKRAAEGTPVAARRSTGRAVPNVTPKARNAPARQSPSLSSVPTRNTSVAGTRRMPTG